MSRVQHIIDFLIQILGGELLDNTAKMVREAVIQYNRCHYLLDT